MKKILALIFVLILQQNVTVFAQLSSDNDPQVDYMHYRTFDWLSPSIFVGKNQEFDIDSTNHYIKANIEKELRARGLIRRSKSPDILISYHIYKKHKKDGAIDHDSIHMFENGFSKDWKYFPSGYGNWPYQWNNKFRQRAYKDGTLIIDIFTEEDKELIWRAEISKGNEAQISQEIYDVFKGYPLKRKWL